MSARESSILTRTGGASVAPALEVEGIARRFGRRWALRGITLQVEPATVVAVVGRNGSGKTTLLRVLATALRPTRGDGRIYGHGLITEAGRIRALVGMLGHVPGVYADLTAVENLLFSLRMAGERPQDGVVRAALQEVGLATEAEERVRGFSAGMQRRLALARLLLRPPRLLLLDEPYASFDAEAVERLHAFVEETRARGGAVLLATHDPDRASEVADRVVRVEAGVVAEDVWHGAPHRDGRTPASLAASRERPVARERAG